MQKTNTKKATAKKATTQEIRNAAYNAADVAKAEREIAHERETRESFADDGDHKMVAFMDKEIAELAAKRDALAARQAPEKIYANYLGYSDVEPYEVVKVCTARKLEIRRMSAELDPSFKPEMIPGGFAGHCTNQRDQKWIYTSSPDAPVIAIRLNKRDEWVKGSQRYDVSDAPHKFYDYNF